MPVTEVEAPATLSPLSHLIVFFEEIEKNSNKKKKSEIIHRIAQSESKTIASEFLEYLFHPDRDYKGRVSDADLKSLGYRYEENLPLDRTDETWTEFKGILDQILAGTSTTAQAVNWLRQLRDSNGRRYAYWFGCLVNRDLYLNAGHGEWGEAFANLPEPRKAVKRAREKSVKDPFAAMNTQTSLEVLSKLKSIPSEADPSITLFDELENVFRTYVTKPEVVPDVLSKMDFFGVAGPATLHMVSELQKQMAIRPGIYKPFQEIHAQLVAKFPEIPAAI